MKRSKAYNITDKIRELYEELHKHQEKCKHKRGMKIPKSNTGNWDPSDDYYWYDCYCPTCLKSWTISAEKYFSGERKGKYNFKSTRSFDKY